MQVNSIIAYIVVIYICIKNYCTAALQYVFSDCSISEDIRNTLTEEKENIQEDGENMAVLLVQDQ